ncbi:MAG: ATP-binding protein [Gammaproteobacteria bacterium]|nr:ATP-binding protein [Gammaproteobacteria bacterium]
MSSIPWTPWHQVVKLREDLKSGELSMSMFAADLYEAVMQSGKHPVYENPAEFFALTYPTHNLLQLARDVAHRLARKNDKAVRQLELTYGGGKTHTLIALFHLASSPEKLPDLPAVAEFRQEIGIELPGARVSALCFDKLDVEKGMEVRDPEGNKRWLKQPWSVLAWQLAGEEGLKLLSADNDATERETAPAENLLTELLEIPARDGLATLVLIDEVLMYAREKTGQDPKWRGRLVNFFQYLTQAATKVNKCAVVASLLATDPAKSDKLGRQLLGELYDVFQREREESVEPVQKTEIAEVLRRRFFTPESIKDRTKFRSQVRAALKGIGNLDKQIGKKRVAAEERFIQSYPFHPDLTEVFYGNWTKMQRFQRTRGVLRIFALALRQAEKWDNGPLAGINIFLTPPDRERLKGGLKEGLKKGLKEGLSEAADELAGIAETEEYEGRHQAWKPVLEREFSIARAIQDEHVGLKGREIEQAVFATFLYSQPIGAKAQIRDLLLLSGASRPDKIELDKGLLNWARQSHWLDDQFTQKPELPDTWRLGNKPNLTQMQAEARRGITDDMVDHELLKAIKQTKALVKGAAEAGVRVHTLPKKPDDVDDDGKLHYAILGAASDSGKPSAEAQRYLREKTGPDKPRVYRNALVLATPSRDGLDVARKRIRDYLAWGQVEFTLRKEAAADAARMQSLTMKREQTAAEIPRAVRQAYCIVVTVSERNEAQAFKITVTDEPLFALIKADKKARIQESAITADALLPGGPYDLWRKGETARRVKDLTEAFAQFPHLPKMLNTEAIFATLLAGCRQGWFVLRLPRPDHTFRTWWRSLPDDAARQDPALEVVLSEAAELAEADADLLAPGILPGLWQGEELTVRAVADYFGGAKVVEVQKEGYSEPMAIPKSDRAVVEKAVEAAVQAGKLWLLTQTASFWNEDIPAGVLNETARLRKPPASIGATELLPAVLADAWQNKTTTALALSNALSQREGVPLPWKQVQTVIDDAIRARFLCFESGEPLWPCDFSGAGVVQLRVNESVPQKPPQPGVREDHNVLAARTELSVAQLQDLGESIPDLLKIKAKANVPLHFNLEIRAGDPGKRPEPAVIEEINEILGKINGQFKLG